MNLFYIFEQKRNHQVHCYYDNISGQWLPMPVGWELQHALVKGQIKDDKETLHALVKGQIKDDKETLNALVKGQIKDDKETLHALVKGQIKDDTVASDSRLKGQLQDEKRTTDTRIKGKTKENKKTRNSFSTENTKDGPLKALANEQSEFDKDTLPTHIEEHDIICMLRACNYDNHECVSTLQYLEDFNNISITNSTSS